MVVGLLIGLAVALGVALYVTKAPNPFVNKVPARPPAQDAAEAERNRNWDPNSALAGRNPAPVPASAPAVATGGAAADRHGPGAAGVDPAAARRQRGPADAAGGSASAPPARAPRAPAAPQASQALRRGRRPVHATSCRPALTLAAKTPSSSAPGWPCSAWRAG